MSNFVDDYIKVVLFDHDDTLVGTIDAKWAHHKHVAKTFYGKDLTDDEIRLHWGKPLRELVCLLYGTEDVEQAMANNTSCHTNFPKLLFPGSIPTLHRLHESGKLLGIITATSRFSFEHDLEEHGFSKDIIDYTQTSDDTSHHKPNPRVFEPTLEWLKSKNIKPNEVLYIGDGLHDRKAALGAGFNFLGVETGLVTPEQFKDAGAVSVPTVADIAKY